MGIHRLGNHSRLLMNEFIDFLYKVPIYSNKILKIVNTINLYINILYWLNKFKYISIYNKLNLIYNLDNQVNEMMELN